MDNFEKQQPSDDRADQNFDGGDTIDNSSDDETQPSIARRLTEMFVENVDGDLLLQRSDREDGVLRWIHALDIQVVGACREDERLKPLLKLNVSTGAAEDRLLAHLSQHFEPSEVGRLARCLCIPLVSVRVGKINKEGTLLSPTSTRGNLCLTLLPTSDLRISFNGDDGSVERLATFSSMGQTSAIEIEEISSDKSGRSFSINISDTLCSYFWCCEKSKLMGTELLRSMKDLLTRKPSLSELTGISESRLNCFATHLRAYLAESKTTTTHPPDNVLFENHISQSSSRTRNYSRQGSNTDSTDHGSGLIPRSTDPFKDSPPMNLSFIRIPSGEKLKWKTEVDDPCSSSKRLEKEKPPEATESHSLSFLDSLPEIHIPFSGTSNFSPQYCLCPVASTIQYSKANMQLPTASTESLPLPPFSSQKITEMPPLVVTTSQQIPTFTPLICDPIIHIPVIDVCSSGQGYLVTAGPAMSTVISPLNTNLMDPLYPNNNNESSLEKGARETLRMLINSSSSNHSNSQILDSLPSVLSSNETRMTSMGLVLLSEKSMGSGASSIGKRCGSREDLNDQKEKKSNEGLD